MPDSKFYKKLGPLKLEEIANELGAELSLEKGGTLEVTDIAPLDAATGSDISFLDNPRYIDSFEHSRAGACIVNPKHAHHAPAGMNLLLTEEPYLAYAQVAGMFYSAIETGVEKYKTVNHAFIAEDAVIGEDVIIEPGAIIKSCAVIGDGTLIGPGAVIGRSVEVGKDCEIGAYSKLQFCLIGNDVILHPGVKIGQDGFGFAFSADGHYIKVPQLGRVIIEDDVEIGANSCVDRGSTPDTVIGMGTKIDNLVQIGHNVKIGRHCIIVAQVGISGSTIIQDGVVVGGQVGIAGHIKIGKGVKIAAKSGVMNDLLPGKSYGGYPCVLINDWHRQTIAVKKLLKNRAYD